MGRADFVNQAVEDWTRALPGADLSGMQTMQLLVWTARAVEDLMNRAAISSGLRRRADYEVLALLRRSEPGQLTPIEVSDALLASPSGMTGKLDRLEQQGLIQRRADPDDRRAIRLSVTDAGRALIDRAFLTSLDLYTTLLAPLAARERESLNSLLPELLARAEELSGMRHPWPTSGSQ